MALQDSLFDGGTLKGIQDAMQSAGKEQGHVNILIAGRSGVGKSTLINSVFEGNFANTGQGRPVTQEARELTKEGIPLTIIDSKGLEMADYADSFKQLEDEVSRRNINETDPNRHIHVAWLCIHEDGRRVEPAEIMLHKMLARYMPVIGVITKARSDNGFKSVVEGLLPETRNIVRVRALAEELDEGIVLQPMGLKELVELTVGVIPEAVQRAFAAAQKVSMQLKKDMANKIVVTAAAAAGAAGLTPIPFSDAAVIVPIQIGMLAKISSIFGVSIEGGLLKSLLFTLVGTTGATIAGRAIVSSLLKFVPGIGTAAGAAISGATAATLTTTLGKIFISTMESVCNKVGDTPPSQEDIVREFKKELGTGRI
jgi:uncharacterized protein (DUF697 family)